MDTLVDFRRHYTSLMAAEAALEQALRNLPGSLAEKRRDIEAALEDVQAHGKFVEGILESTYEHFTAIADPDEGGGGAVARALRAAIADEISSGGLMHYELPKEA